MSKRQFSPDDRKDIRQQLSLLDGDPDMEVDVKFDLFLRYGIGLGEAWRIIEED